MKTPARLKSHLAPVLFLVVLTCAVYARTLGHDFLLNWDDAAYVTGNEAIRGVTPAHLRQAFTHFYVGNYAPLQIVSYMLDYSLWGLTASGFIASNILLHILNGILFYALVTKLTGSRLHALIAGYIFLLHPVQVESVAWVSQRKNLLAMFFFLGSFLFYLCRRENGGLKGKLCLGASLAAFTGALLSKSVAIILPPVLILYDLCFGEKGDARKRLADKIPYLVVAVAMALVTLTSQAAEMGGGKRPDYYGGTPLATLFTMMPVFFRYLGNLVWPVHLSAAYDPPVKTAIDGEVALAAVLLILLAVGAVRLYRRQRRLFFWGAIFVVGLVPVAQIIPLVTLMNDRYLYFPMLGAAPFITSVALSGVEQVRRPFRLPVIALLVLTLFALPLVSYQRAGVWRDTLSLWTDVYQKQPDSVVAGLGLSDTYNFIGRPDLAIPLLEKVLTKVPFNRDALLNIAENYKELGRFGEAGPHLARLVARYPDFPDGFLALGDVALLSGDLAGAEAAYLRALQLRPASGYALSYLGIVYARMQRVDLARDCYRRALAAGEDNVQLREMLR